jgi:hypothetical protein
MTKPKKTWEDRSHTLDADWPPHQSLTIMTWSQAPVLSIGISLPGVTRAGVMPPTRTPVLCSNACWLMPADPRDVPA